jgi:hypothetical protein
LIGFGVCLQGMNTFAVVKSTGKRKHADECEDRTHKKYSKGHFFCIDCGNDVFVRRGQKKVWHFAHYCEEAAKKCPHANGGETKEHYDAKHFIASNIHRCVFAVEKCTACMKRRFFVGRRCDEGNHQHIHECIAEVEKRIPGTKRVADVAAMNSKSGNVVAAIEVFHTHETDSDKRKECAALGIPVLEVTTMEVQRAQAYDASRKPRLVQMATTNMLNKRCAECAMRREKMNELKSIIEYEKWHTDSSAEFYGDVSWNPVLRAAAKLRRINAAVLKRLRKTQSNSVQEYFQELEHEKWYAGIWDLYGKRLDARRNHRMISNERRAVLKRGFDAAHAKISRQQVMPASKRAHKKHRVCVTKCKGCDKWVFGDDSSDDVCKVKSSSMPESEWKELFAKDPMQFRKRYECNNGDHNFIQVHEGCAIPCPGCNDFCLIQKIAKFGACFSCNSCFKGRLRRLEARM